MRLAEVARVDSDCNASEPLQPPLPADAPPSPKGTGMDRDEGPQSDYAKLQARRRETPIAPPNVDSDALPSPLYECECKGCPDHVDPLHGDFGSAAAKAWNITECCSDPTPVSWEKAARIYLRLQVPRYRRDDARSKAERQLSTYRKILATDRRLFADYESMTIALVSLRSSPTDEDGQWLSPWRIDESVHAPWANVYDRLRYELSTYEGLEWEYVAVTGGTVWFATPHRHILVWADDPDNALSEMHFRSAVETFVSQCQYATERGHPLDNDSTVRIDHEPEQVNGTGERGNPFDSVTAPALYTATSLPHLCLHDRFDRERHCSLTDIEASALAWASPFYWLNSSSGVRYD